MHNIKSHKSVESIAKKHRLDVSFIQKQLDMGEPIEHEHTQDHDLAMDIALQHLDEIPDYYTRLKKMESDAKKEHKKFKDVKEHCGCEDNAVSELESGLKKSNNISYNSIDTLMRRIMKKHDMSARQLHDAFVNKHNKTPDTWIKTMKESHEEKRYCPLCDKKETRSECSYGGKAWDKVSVKDHEYSMARSELSTISNAVKRLQKKVGKGEGNLEAWVQSKITKAADYIDTVADYIDSGEMSEGISFDINKDKNKKLTRPQEKLHSMTPKQRSQLPKEMVKKLIGTSDLPPLELNKVKKESVTLVDKILGELEEDKKGLWANIHARRKKGLPRKKPGQKGYPETLDIDEGIRQARKNVGASKCWTGKKLGTPKTKLKGGKEVPNCVSAESLILQDANGNDFLEIVDLIKPEPIKGFKCQIEEATRLQSQSGNIVMATLLWKGKYYSLKMFFPQIKLPNRKEIEEEMQKVYPGCRLVHHEVSQFAPGEPLIQSCNMQGGSPGKIGPSKNYVKAMGEDVNLDEDWQSANRKDGVDGLSQSTVNQYRREHPGSKLQTAVTEKKPKGKRAGRRKRFCSRMKGMKSKLTSAKTARDPDSRINKALRRWRCR